MSEQKEKKSTELRWLEAAELTAVYDAVSACLTIRLKSGEEYRDVRVAQGFPVTDPGSFVDFADSKGEPIGMVRSISAVEPESLNAIRKALEAGCLIPSVSRILDLFEAGPSVLRWKVLTNHGECVFYTESPRESIRFQTPDRVRISDLSDNDFDIVSISALDVESRRLLAIVL